MCVGSLPSISETKTSNPPMLFHPYELKYKLPHVEINGKSSSSVVFTLSPKFTGIVHSSVSKSKVVFQMSEL